MMNSLKRSFIKENIYKYYQRNRQGRCSCFAPQSPSRCPLFSIIAHPVTIYRNSLTHHTSPPHTSLTTHLTHYTYHSPHATLTLHITHHIILNTTRLTHHTPLAHHIILNTHHSHHTTHLTHHKLHINYHTSHTRTCT